MGVKGCRPKRQGDVELHQEPQLIYKVEDIIANSFKTKEVDDYGNVDISSIAKLNDIDISYETMESSKSGYLKYIDSKWVIGVNSLHNKRRQRFTIAHELGHYFMHREKNLDFEDATFFRNDHYSSIEYSANEFAARLLMPEDRVRDAILKGIKNIERLAEMFNVSAAAIKYRVVALGYRMKENG